MKTEMRNRMKVAGVGAAFVVGLLVLSYLHNPSPDITTPEQDAQMLRLKAETIHSEADLRELEKLAYEYEMAYKHSYDGAKAMYFKSLCEPILIEAGDRREQIRAEEDHLANEQRKFNETLDNIDEAWRMKLGSDEEILATLDENAEAVYALESDISQLQFRKQQLGEEAWNGPGGTLDEKCLEEIGKVEESIKKLEKSIDDYIHKNHIISLACRLQRGGMPTYEVVEAAVEAVQYDDYDEESYDELW